jgi:hypothetical protein
MSASESKLDTINTTLGALSTINTALGTINTNITDLQDGRTLLDLYNYADGILEKVDDVVDLVTTLNTTVMVNTISAQLTTINDALTAINQRDNTNVDAKNSEVIDAVEAVSASINDGLMNGVDLSDIDSLLDDIIAAIRPVPEMDIHEAVGAISSSPSKTFSTDVIIYYVAVGAASSQTATITKIDLIFPRTNTTYWPTAPTKQIQGAASATQYHFFDFFGDGIKVPAGTQIKLYGSGSGAGIVGFQVCYESIV